MLLSDFPVNLAVDEKILLECEKVREIITTALSLRNQAQIKVKQPIKTLYIESDLQDLCKDFEQIIKNELNVKEIEYLPNFDSLCTRVLHLNFKTAGAKLKNRVNEAKEFISKLTPEQTNEILTKLDVNEAVKLGDFDVDFEKNMFDITNVFNDNIKADVETINVAIDTSLSAELEKEGILRELLRSLQVARKDAGFDVADRIFVDLSSADDYMQSIIDDEKSTIEKETLSQMTLLSDCDLSREFDLRGYKVTAKLKR